MDFWGVKHTMFSIIPFIGLDHTFLNRIKIEA
jgi:hypothetical protein